MRIPVIHGVIDRRLLVNYRVDPARLARLLPAPFRPQLVNGHGMAGICLIRLRGVHPRFWPAWLGIRSENAAHRIAVEWDDGAVVRCGVYVARRDSSSHLNALAGGRLFPGVHHHARFDVNEGDGRYQVRMTADDRSAALAVDGVQTAAWPSTSVFGSVDEASAFFAAGALGYSPNRRPGCFDGLELRCAQWQVEPLAVQQVSSSFFDDRTLFPAGSAAFDCALLMRNVVHEWHSRDVIKSQNSSNKTQTNPKNQNPMSQTCS